MRSRFIAFLAASLLCLSFVQTASAQWTQLANFPSDIIRVVYFLDQQGLKGQGLLGMQSQNVEVTSDGGTTWVLGHLPTWGLNSKGRVVSFAFENATDGWAALAMADPSISGAVWRSTNAGLDWVNLYPAQDYTAISYNDSNHLIFANGLTGSGRTSTNGGTTWPNTVPVGRTGYAWADKTTGVMACDTGCFYRTTNGGSTWIRVGGMTAPCWQPYAVPGTSTFYAASYGDKKIYRSDDGGATWGSLYTFATPLTGDIEGTHDTLFVQTTTSGFYESTDQGTSWWPMCGPSAMAKTRFWVKYGEIYASQTSSPGSSLWRLQNAAMGGVWPTPTTLSQRVMTFNSYKCGSYDSVLAFGYHGGCALTVNSVQISGSPNFTLGSLPSMPQAFFGTDSIHVKYSAPKVKRDTGYIHINYTVNSVTHDTLIRLYSVPTTNIHVAQSTNELDVNFKSGCETQDTAIWLKNLACDSIVITAADLDSVNAFQVQGVMLPFTLQPSDSIRVPIHVSQHYLGDYHAKLHLHFVSDLISADTSIPLFLRVHSTPWPTMKAMSVTIPNKCKAFDTVITIHNSLCDSLTLDSTYLDNQSAFQIMGLKTPLVIQGRDSLRITLHLDPAKKGTVTATFSMRFHAGIDTLDTVIKVTLNTQADILPALKFNSANYDFGTASPCAPKDGWLIITNDVCRSKVITGIKFTDGNDSAFSIGTISLPDTITGGRTDSIALHFHPKTGGSPTATAIVSIEVDGLKHDTLIRIHGLAYSSVTAELETDSLQMGTVSTCNPTTATTYLTNESCDSVLVTAASLLNTSNGYLLSAGLPRWLDKGDTMQLHVTLTPSASGNVTDTIDVRVRGKDPSSTEVSRILGVFATVVRGGATLAIATNEIRADSLAPCTTLDTTFTISNLSACDTGLLNSVSIKGDGAVAFVGNPSLPIPLGQKKALTLHLLITPAKTGATVDSMHIVGVGLDTIIVCHVSVRQTNGTTLNVQANEPHYAVRLCSSLSKKILIQSAGCDPISVESIYLEGMSGQTQFTIEAPPTTPLPLAGGQSMYITVHFDPSGVGDSTVRLHVLSGASKLDHVVTLTGGVIGAPVATRFGVTALDGTLATSNHVEEIAHASLRTLDAIGDTLGLSTLTAHVAVNGDVLTMLAVNPKAGWSLLNRTDEGAGVYKLQMKYTGASTIAAGTEIATMDFFTTVGDSTFSEVHMTDAKLNETDATFERCSMQPLVATKQLVMTVNDKCGDATIRSMLDGKLVEWVGMYPNPAGSSAHESSTGVKLDLMLKGRADVAVSLQDATGLVVRKMDLPSLASGKHSVAMSLDHVASGVYFVAIEAGGERLVRKLVVQQ